MSSCNILFFLQFALCVLCGKCEDLYKQAGGEVSMKCVVPQKSNIEWRFNDALLVGIHGKTGTIRRGYIPLSNKAKLHGDTLTIPKLESGDSGLYSCKETGDKYRLHIVSIFVKPGAVLLQSSDAELHCNIAGSTDTEVQWLRPPDNENYSERNQIIHLKSVTSKEEGQWTCSVKGLKLSVTLTVVAGLQTKDVEVPEGGDIELPCSLPRPVSQRVVGGTWKADHLPRVSFPTLKNTEDKGLHWNGENSAEVTFTSGQLSTSYNVTLRNVKPSNKGTYVCTVEFEGGVKLSAEMNLSVTSKTKGENKNTNTKKKGPAGEEGLSRTLFGLQLWIWIIVGVLSVVLIGLIIVIVLVHKRNKQMKKEKAAAGFYSQRLLPVQKTKESQMIRGYEVGHQDRPLPMPRQQRNPRTAGPNHKTVY